MHDSVQTIRNAFSTLRRSSKARHRAIAEQLCLSVGELMGARAGSARGEPNVTLHATRLRPEGSGIMESPEPLGEAMALTRNASCVHEKTGVYRNASHQNHVGLVLGGAIDLRIF